MSTANNTFKLLINGRLVDGDQTMDVINPATAQPLARSPRASLAQLDEAVAAAKSALPGWTATPMAARKKAFGAIAGIIQGNAPELARLLTQEQGKPIAEATGEIMGMAALFGFFTTLDLPVETLEDSPARRVEAYRNPLGVVAAIVPWNTPLVLLTTKLAPALLCGNTVVVKTAPTTPLATLRVGALIKDALPPGVLNIITDANDLGDALTGHPDISKVAFTGSVATGRRVMGRVAESIKRVTLELGGNDAAIVLDDANVKEIAPRIFHAAFQNAGQICMAIKRLYVHESIYDEMCRALTAIANATIVGDGLLTGTQLGPLQNKMQYDRVRQLIEAARRDGKVTTSDKPLPDSGYFIRPTIVRDISEGSRLVDEEQFGPVLPIIRYSDPHDAVARANATPFGLGASVWSSNLERAHDLARQLDAGSVWVNKHFDIAPHIPFGGAKLSGLGTELGKDCLAEYTQLKIINIALGGAGS